MASLKEAGKLTQQLNKLAGQLHAEYERQGDFGEMVRLADELGESADTLASTFAAIDEALSQRLQTGGPEEGEGAEDEPERSGERGAQRRGEERAAQRRGEGQRATGGEEPTREELLERAKEAGVAGRSGMSKDELQKAVESFESLSRDELLERAKEAGIAGRSGMSKEELKEALKAEESISKEELLERAKDADIPGRSEMSKEELREALRSA